MIHIQVQTAPFDIAQAMQRMQGHSTEIGAVASFVGFVRDHNVVDAQTCDIAALSLEHYPGMTEKALTRIVERATERWNLQAVTLVHRVGDLYPGDPIVLVLTASAHRQAAFDACQYIMDYLKTEAPFWKKETLPDGSQRWVNERDSDHQAAARWQDV